MIEWDDRYSVNIANIDENHKRFFDIINKAILVGQHRNRQEELAEALSEVIQHASRHFIIEEICMIKFAHPEYESHREEHLNFTTKTIAYLERVVKGDPDVEDEIFMYLRPWLADHIQGVDRKYIDCFKKNGLK
jgi:hemerythrin-like metal-binding protein